MTVSASDPIRVGFVLHLMQVAGAEILVTEIIRRLTTRIVPVILCLDDVGELGVQLRQQGVPVIVLGRRPGFDRRAVSRIAAEISHHRLEIVHAHQYTPFFYAALGRLVTRQRIHLMFTEHGRHYPDVVSWKRRMGNRLILSRLADEITGVCRFSAESLSQQDGFRGRVIEVVPNGIEVERYRHGRSSELKSELGLHADRRYLICAARFHPVKDHATLLKAFAQVVPRVGDVDLLLAGDGPLRASLERLATDLGIAGRTKFLGTRSDIASLLRAADGFIMTSVSEAASLTLLEAMATGLPVIVTAVGGNPEIVQHDVHGFLVPRGDDSAAASSMLALLQQPDKAWAMGAAGRERVRTYFNLDQTVENYYQRYRLAAVKLRASGDPVPEHIR